MFTYDIYNDVRLVGAPPSSIGKFGGDTDNWMWPRHTGISPCLEFMQIKKIIHHLTMKTISL